MGHQGGRLAQQSALRLRQTLDEATAKLGFGHAGSIPEAMSFREWCEELARAGMKVDRKPFKLSDRPALLPVYDAIPKSREEAAGRTLVIQKSTQIGLTVWETLADIYMAKKWAPLNIGLFVPSQKTATTKSEHRFMPIIRSVPALYHEMTHRRQPDGSMKRIGEGNVLIRSYGESLLMFLWTTGRVSTESNPMDVVSLDEVQGMTGAEIEKVMARMGDSPVQFGLMLSTAFMPDEDINRWYQRGNQEVWHTRCLTCDRENDLSDPVGIFPELSIGFSDGSKYRPVINEQGVRLEPPTNDYVWTCPHCRGWIPDPQLGRYISQNPTPKNPKIRSLLLPRTISPRITPAGMLDGFQRAKTGDEKMSFYNRTLARPYIDADQLPVTLEHCKKAAEEGMRRGLRWEKKAEPGAFYVMGIDQMKQFNVVTVLKRLKDGRPGLVHCEAIFNEDPFERCAELMRIFNIAVCCLEQLPNANDALRFANRPAHRRRVFLNTSFASDPRTDMITWGDAATRNDKKTEESVQSRFTVNLNQYKAMQYSLHRVRNCELLFPDPDALEQDVLENGKPKRVKILRDWLWHHLTKTALVVIHDEEQRKPKFTVQKIGLDPHFSFALMLANVAWARQQGTGSIILPDDEHDHLQTNAAQAVAEAMPGLPKEVLAMIDSLPPGVCGRCISFRQESGECAERGLTVGARDPGCPLFIKREE